jgi:hypothetical protein
MEAKWRIESPCSGRSANVRSLHFPLDIVGEVQVHLNDEAILVTAEHDAILVDLPRRQLGLGALRSSGRRAHREKVLQRMQATLQLADLTVHFRLMGRIVGRLGTGARPGVLSWVLGVRPLEIRPAEVLSLITALWR